MNAANKNTALLIFSHTPELESRRKQFVWGQGKKANVAVARQLLRATLRTAKGSGLDVHLISSELQRGDSFGERLANAYEDLFAQGYSNVISIGNDSPGLTAKMLRTAAAMLEGESPVLGPAKDGGVYLIGLSKAHWNRAEFLDIAWETEQVAGQWAAFAQHRGLEIEWLRECRDIDGHLDLNAFLHSRPHNLFSKKIRSILAASVPPRSFSNVFIPQTFFSNNRRLRGPPVH